MLMNERRLIVVPVLPVGSTLLLVHGGQILVLGVRYKVNRVEDVGQSTNALEYTYWEHYYQSLLMF